jgi:hypothetical protein
MSGEIEAAGALATAGAVAGVIEGREGQGQAEGPCLNCGAQLTGPFCAQCGQNGRPLRKLTQLGGEFLHSLFHFDTKAWRTLPMVLFRPGTLTRDYIYGKRARYISPLATFLLCVFALFFVFSWVGGAEFGNGFNDAMEITQEDLDEARTDLAEARAELEQARANPDPDEPEGLAVGLAEGAVARAEAAVARLEAQLEAQRDVAESEADDPSAPASAPTTSDTAAPETAAPDAAAPDTAAAPDADAPPAENSVRTTVGISVGEDTQIDGANGRWQDQMSEAVESGELNVNTGNPYLDERMEQSLRNPDLALYRVQEAASKFSFLLAPLSLPFIALLFLWKRGVTLYDHVVYALYALSFACVIFMALMLGAAAMGGNAAFMVFFSNALLLVALPVHTFFQLKGAYALGWFSALWRTFFMMTFAVIIASVFFLLVLVLGLVG